MQIAVLVLAGMWFVGFSYACARRKWRDVRGLRREWPLDNWIL